MIAVHLHGGLGAECGGLYRLAVRSPAEAIRALRVQIPRFRAMIEGGQWYVVRGPLASAPAGLGDVATGFAPHETEMHVMPALAGGGRFGPILLGVALIGASFLIPPAAGVLTFGLTQGALATTAFTTGLGLALSGAAALLSPSPRSRFDQAERLQSDIFGQLVNTARAGAAFPVNFGHFEAGGVVLSAGITVEDSA